MGVSSTQQPDSCAYYYRYVDFAQHVPDPTGVHDTMLSTLVMLEEPSPLDDLREYFDAEDSGASFTVTAIGPLWWAG